MRYAEFRNDTSLHPITMIQYAPDHEPMMALVVPRASRLVDESTIPLNHQDWNGALAMLQEADSLQKDRGAGNFFALLNTRRAVALCGLDRMREGEAAARKAFANWPGSQNAHYWIAFALAGQARYAEADAVLDSSLAIFPNDTLARELRTVVRKELSKTSR
jgi:tetratricopeptide (TPR) repeat protein